MASGGKKRFDPLLDAHKLNDHLAHNGRADDWFFHNPRTSRQRARIWQEVMKMQGVNDG